MAIVYPADPNAPPVQPSGGSRVLTFVDQHIVLSIALALGVAVVVGFLINKLRGGSASSSSAANQQPQTLYVPTSNTFETNTTTNNNPPPSTIPPSFVGPPTPAPGGTNGGFYYTTKQGDTVANIYQAAQSIDPGAYWGEDRILLANPALVGYNYNSSLPAGLKVQVGGPLPAIGSGGDPFLDGHLPAMRTLFSTNHGVAHHVANVVGA